MKNVGVRYARLLETQPGETPEQRLQRISSALELGDDDALWIVLLACGHYENLYSKIPQQIGETATKVLDGIKAAAEAEIRACVETTKKDLSETVGKASVELAGKVASAKRWQWLGLGLCIGASVALIALFAGFSRGKEAGLALGYAQARDEKAASTWSATADGKLAYQLYRTGILRGCGSFGTTEVTRGA